MSIKNKTIPVKNKTSVSTKKHNKKSNSIDSFKQFVALSVLFLLISSTLTGIFNVNSWSKKIYHFNHEMKVTKILNVKENENYFFTDMIIINNFDSS